MLIYKKSSDRNVACPSYTKGFFFFLILGIKIKEKDINSHFISPKLNFQEA